MTDVTPSAPSIAASAASAPVPPTQSFNARVVAGIAAAVTAVGGFIISALPESGPPKITPAAKSGAELGVHQRLAAVKSPPSAAPYNAYLFVNPDTQEKGLVEVVGKAEPGACQNIIVTGGGLSNHTLPASAEKNETRRIPVGQPMRYCPE